MRIAITIAYLFVCSTSSMADPSGWAKQLCVKHPAEYKCHTIRTTKHSARQYFTWEERFKDKREHRIVIAINRRNTLLWRGHVYAIPKDWSKSYLSHAPFPHEKFWSGPRHVVVDLKQLAWGAYEVSNGKAKLVKWGVANGGIGRCKETGKYTCRTPAGTWQVYEVKRGFARSSLYPVECVDKKTCGHPYYNVMKFGPNFEALHGERSGHIPGMNVSHGCVRILREDSEYLVNHFVDVGTTIIVLKY